MRQLIRSLGLAMSLALASASTQGHTLINLVQGDTTIRIANDGGRVAARAAPARAIYGIDPPLARLLQRVTLAEQLLELDDGHDRYVVVLTKELSRPKAMGRGQCGSGEEAMLVLIAIDGRMLRIRDQLLIASCFQSTELDAPAEAGITSLPGLEVDDVEDTVRFSWLGDGPGTRRVLTVERGRFSLVLQSAPAKPE